MRGDLARTVCDMQPPGAPEDHKAEGRSYNASAEITPGWETHSAVLNYIDTQSSSMDRLPKIDSAPVRVEFKKPSVLARVARPRESHSFFCSSFIRTSHFSTTPKTTRNTADVPIPQRKPGQNSDTLAPHSRPSRREFPPSAVGRHFRRCRHTVG
jgi:hypothetical protein